MKYDAPAILVCIAIVVVFFVSYDAGRELKQEREMMKVAKFVDLDTLTVQEANPHAIVEALAIVESSNDPTKEGLLDELGLLQIRPVLVRDVNRILGQEIYTDEDRLCPEKSREMFWVYSDFWNIQKEDHTIQGMIRRWNGGPRGHLKEATMFHWHKVRARLRTLIAD